MNVDHVVVITTFSAEYAAAEITEATHGVQSERSKMEGGRMFVVGLLQGMCYESLGDIRTSPAWAPNNLVLLLRLPRCPAARLAKSGLVKTRNLSQTTTPAIQVRRIFHMPLFIAPRALSVCLWQQHVAVLADVLLSLMAHS